MAPEMAPRIWKIQKVRPAKDPTAPEVHAGLVVTADTTDPETDPQMQEQVKARLESGHMALEDHAALVAAAEADTEDGDTMGMDAEVHHPHSVDQEDREDQVGLI
jgi:hypothetical protein